MTSCEREINRMWPPRIRGSRLCPPQVLSRSPKSVYVALGAIGAVPVSTLDRLVLGEKSERGNDAE